MTVKRPTFESPYGCRWCGDSKHHHGRQWTPVIGMHTWEQPSPAMILERMRRRREAFLNAEPAMYHATTGWAADHTGESADPYCLDCKTDGCPRWTRIQARLDQQRWSLPRRVRRTRKTATWGGGESWPF